MILFENTFAYIPLFAITAVSVIMLILFSAIKKKKTARISFIAYLSTIIIGTGSFISAVKVLFSEDQSNAFGFFACAAPRPLL